MPIKTTPNDIYREYIDGVNYNQRIELYDNVERGENFYIGKHWEGVNAPDLDKPVFPMLKNVVSHFIATIVADDVAVRISDGDTPINEISDIVSREIDKVVECEKIKSKHRTLIRNGAVDGDYCMYLWYDPDAETGQRVKGMIRATVIDNTNVIFGNPRDSEVQAQPFILLPLREMVDDVKREAKKNGVAEADIDRITEDNDPYDYGHDYAPSGLTTTIIKLWRDYETGTIHAIKTTSGVVVRETWDTKLRLYPIAYASWEPIKNSYHGTSEMTALIPNQIFVNKLYAMAMQYVKGRAFPKVAYDMTKLPKGYSDKIGAAIATVGNPNDAMIRGFAQPDMSNQVFTMLDSVVQRTQELSGAGDSTLGTANPENTSAIIAMVKQAAIPLEIKKQTFYQFIEDYVRIMVEMMGVHYGEREVPATNENGDPVVAQFDFGQLRDMNLRLTVDVGESAYWSEITQQQSLDALFDRGLIPDPVLYIESIPSKHLPNKQRLIDALKQQQFEQQQQAMMQNAEPAQIAQQPAQQMQEGA